LAFKKINLGKNSSVSSKKKQLAPFSCKSDENYPERFATRGKLTVSHRDGFAMKILLTLLSITTIALSGLWLFSSRSTPIKRLTPFEVVASDLDLGTIWASETHRHTITVRNPNSQPLVITEITSSCGCTSNEPKSLTLAAGESKTISLVLNLSGNRMPSMEEWPVEMTLMFRINDEFGKGTVPIVLSGRARRRVTMMTDGILFKEKVYVGRNPPSQAMEFSIRDGGTPVVQAEGIETKIDSIGGTNYRLTMKAPGIRSVGDFTIHVRINSKQADDRIAEGIVFPLSGTISETSAVLPAYVSLGSLVAGESRDESVALIDSFQEGWRIISVRSNDSNLTVLPESQTNNRFIYRVTHGHTGHVLSHLSVNIRDNTNTERTHLVYVAYYGR
jgi:hypothetical protein